MVIDNFSKKQMAWIILLLGACVCVLLVLMVSFQMNKRYEPVSMGTRGMISSKTRKSANSDGLDAWERLLMNNNYDKIMDIARNNREKYRTAIPFPHIQIDELFPVDIVEAIASEVPEFFSPSSCTTDAQWGCKMFNDAEMKFSLHDEHLMSPYTRMMIAFLKSSIWLQFLEELTGIDNIVPDPGFLGSGLHVTAPGGFLNVHADFNKLERYSMGRRVNTFLYLNDNWKDEYGGDLELWDKNLTTCAQKIKPLFGKYVVFSTTDFSYHGHPHPLAAPADRSRRSLALYYYVNGPRPVEECVNNDCDYIHSTLYKTTECKCTAPQTVCPVKAA